MEAGRMQHGGVDLAWQRLPGRGPCLVFLPGYRSDMTGDKAQALVALCEERAQSLLLFDYSGHGASGGAFTDGTISRWTADALAVMDSQAEGKLVLAGSSMGGWIALLAALARPDRIAGFVGMAAAPDFTEALMWQTMTPADRAVLQRDGVLHLPSAYGEPTPVTRALIEDGRRHLLLGSGIKLRSPVRLLHGQADADVPWETALRLAQQIESEDGQVTLVKDATHRLSRPGDLLLLRTTVAGLLDL